MRTLLYVVFASVCLWPCYAIKPGADFYKALSTGARVKMVCHVTDETGAPVVKANVRVILAQNDTEHSLFGSTDTNGIYVIDGKTTGNYIQLAVDKQGYYSSWKQWTFIDMGGEHDVRDGRWQPYGGEELITLRRILKKVPLVNFDKIIEVPATNVWIGFDMEKKSFVQPYGTGYKFDFEINVEWDGLPAWESKNCRAKIRLDAPLCGGYYVGNVLESKFPYPYYAKPSSVFPEKIVSIVDRAGDPHQTKIPFRKNASLVTRTRCVINEKGGVESANYGCIRRIGIGPSRRGVALLRISYVFNSTPNDTNLEPK